jgi:hypothetical protein
VDNLHKESSLYFFDSVNVKRYIYEGGIWGNEILYIILNGAVYLSKVKDWQKTG